MCIEAVKHPLNRLLLTALQDFTVFGGSLSSMHAKKICKVCDSIPEGELEISQMFRENLYVYILGCIELVLVMGEKYPYNRKGVRGHFRMN